MNLQQLVTFSTVIAEGSMTAAAEKLYLTQPAVSQQIRNLEEEMGVNLLLRGTRQARPTTQGQLLFDYAKKIIALTQQAQVAVQTMGEGIQGHLRVGTLNSLGLYMISPLVGGFLKHNPKTQISLSYEDGHQVLKALKQGELDVAILPDVTQEYGLDTDGLDGRVLMKDEIWLVASSKDVSAPTQVSLRELSEKPIVRFSEKYFGFEKVLNGEVEKQKLKLQTVFECNNVGTVKRVIESGLGWGFLPAHSIRKQVRAGRMTAIEVNEIKHSVPVVYYVRSSEVNSQITETFYRAVKQPVGNN